MQKKRFLIIIIIFLLLGGGAAGFFFWKNSTATASTPQAETVNTTMVRRGTIEISATGVGTVIPKTDLQIGFDISGTIADIYVEVGDDVSIGDEIALLEDDPTLIADYTTSQIAVYDAQQAVEDLQTNWGTDLAQLKIDYLTAKEELEDLKVERAGLNYKRCVDTTIENLEADYYSAKDNLERIQDQYNQFFITRDPEDLGKQQMEAQIANAQVELDTALANWQYCLQTPSQDEKDMADAEIVLKEAEITAYEKQIESLENGVDANELAQLEANVTLAEAQMEEAKYNMTANVLSSPIEGTVMEINAEIGEDVSANSAFVRVANISDPIVEIYLDETDFEMVQVGYTVNVIFDAFPDDTFQGTIISVSPELIAQGNVNYVYALVELNPDSFAKPVSLPINLNATVDVIGGLAENVLVVPVEALVELDENEYAVFVMENGEPKLRVVEVGLMDFTYAEIISGLSLGEQVTTGIVEIAE